MRLVVAIFLFAVAIVSVGLGIAQRTLWAPPDRVTSLLQLESTEAVTVIDGTALNAYDGRQTVAITGGVVAPITPEPEPSETPADASATAPPADEIANAPAESDAVVAAYGRTADVLGWVGSASYNLVTFDSESRELISTVVRGSEKSVPTPIGSDLWFGEYQGEGELGVTVNVSGGISMLVVSDGILPAPQKLSVTWPLDASTPFSTLLILGGVGSLIVGLFFLLWALLHMRVQRGPRRKPSKMPKVPKPARLRASGGRTALGRPKGRRALGRIALTPMLLSGALMLAACTGGGSAFTAVSATPDASARAAAPAVAVTENQLERIVSRIGTTVALADADKNDDLAASRLAGPALTLRRSSYAIRDSDAALGVLAAIPTEDVQLTLPQRLPAEGDTWPRSVFAIVQEPALLNDAGEEVQGPPLALLMVQEDPRSQYRVHYAITVTLGEDASRPEVAPASLGAPVLPSDTTFLSVSPAEVAAGYADVLLRGEESESFLLFQSEGDTLIEQIGAQAKAARRSSLPSTAQITFSNSVGEADIFAFVTNDGGALVAAYLTESERVTPTQTGAAINAPPPVAALAGRSQSTQGIIATYGIQVLFYVPAVGSDQQIVLLGYTQGLINAREVS